MAKTSLTISGLNKEMTSDEVKQTLATLYQKPEDYFDDLCESLFTTKKSHVLLKSVEESTANAHIEKLTKLGFKCGDNSGEADMGLSLMPVSAATGIEAVCPACEERSGGEEICQSCGVIIKKYLEHKEFDDQIVSQIKANTSSQERMDKRYADGCSKKKQQALLKKKSAKEKKLNKKVAPGDEEGSADQVAVEKPNVVVAGQVHNNVPIYAAIASLCVVLVGGGYLLHQYANQKSMLNESSLAADVSSDADQPSSIVQGNAESSSSSTELALAPKTLFDEHQDRKRNLKIMKNKLNRLYKEEMYFSATAFVSQQEDGRDKLIGKQEIIRLEATAQGALAQESAEELRNAAVLIAQLDGEVDRVDALLNQSSVYSQFDFLNNAANLYEQAATLTFEMESADQRVLAETAIAEHRIEHGDKEGARERFKLAKDNILELSDVSLADSAFAYVALSEASQGLTADAKLTCENIEDKLIHSHSEQQISAIAILNKKSGKPELSAAIAKKSTGDKTVDDLIKMNENNQRVFNAASGLVGQ